MLFSFDGSAGLGVLWTFGGFGGAQFDLYNPAGVKLFTKTPSTSTNITLATSGIYTLLVHDGGYTATGTYGFSVTCIGCNYQISPSSISVPADGSTGTVNVSVGAGCTWTATTNTNWLSIISGASGSGNGTVSYAVAPNTSTNARTGTLTITNRVFTVNQAGAPVPVGHDVGDVGVPGGFTPTNGVYTVWGSGEDIEDNADAFFFVHKPLAGNGEIIARVLSLQAPQSTAEVGVMFRETLDAGSKHVFLRLNAGTNAVFRRRLATGANSLENPYSGTNSAWLRLMRMGNTFVGFCSSNGVDWKYVWFTTISMSNQVEVGLAVTAHHRGEYATGRVDNVSFGPLTPLSGIWPLAAPQIYLGGEPLGGNGLQAQGGFKMLVRGTVGDYYRIHSSPVVDPPSANWPVAGTVTNQWGAALFLDPQALINSRRFYSVERFGP